MKRLMQSVGIGLVSFVTVVSAFGYGAKRTVMIGGQESANQISKEFSVAQGQQISFDLPTGGGVSITGWDSNTVSVTATLGGPDGPNCAVDMQQTGSGIEVKSSYNGSDRGYSTNIRIEVQVPRQFNVKVDSAGGAIKIQNVEGTINGTTGGGAIKISNAKGNITMSTGGGAILVEDSELDGTVSTGGGHVKIKGNKGNLVGTTGGGKVEVI